MMQVGSWKGNRQSELEFDIGKTAATWSRRKKQKQRRIWVDLVTRPMWLLSGGPWLTLQSSFPWPRALSLCHLIHHSLCYIYF